MITLRFSIEIIPYPWRVVGVRRGTFAAVVVHSKTLAYQKALKKHFILERPDRVPQGAVTMNLTFRMPRARTNKDPHHLKDPDRTNLLKSTEDAMKGSFFKDDNAVISGSTVKRYVEAGEKPGVDFELIYEETYVKQEQFDPKGQRNQAADQGREAISHPKI